MARAAYVEPIDERPQRHGTGGAWLLMTLGIAMLSAMLGVSMFFNLALWLRCNELVGEARQAHAKALEADVKCLEALKGQRDLAVRLRDTLGR